VTTRRSAESLLRDIVANARRAIGFMEGVEGPDALRDDTKTLYAVIHALEVVGEAVKGLPDALRAAHPEIPWRQMAAMRDRLIHGYFAVDPAVVHATVRGELPELLPLPERALEGVGVRRDQGAEG